MSVYMPLDCDGFAAAARGLPRGGCPRRGSRGGGGARRASARTAAQLLEDLNTIRHDAAALPALAPSRDLWSGIAERIDATRAADRDGRFADHPAGAPLVGAARDRGGGAGDRHGGHHAPGHPGLDD